MNEGGSRTQSVCAEALGARVIYETLAEGLVNIPSENILTDLRNIALILDEADLFDFESRIGPDSKTQLEKAFYDRFFVVTHPQYIPLRESDLLAMQIKGGGVSYGKPRTGIIAHASNCYRETGFDFRKITGYEMAIKSLKADSMASELSFMAFLHDGSSSTKSEAQALAHERLALSFLEQHLNKWASKAADIAANYDDIYARLLSLIATWVQFDHERLNDLLKATRID